jgi:hypothetical protein
MKEGRGRGEGRKGRKGTEEGNKMKEEYRNTGM